MLRLVEPDDIEHFFVHQADPVSYELADVPSRNRIAFDILWSQLLPNPEVTIRTIETDGAVAGYVFAFPRDGELRLGYWLGREFWGRGIASGAVAEFLELEPRRPIFATVHQDNAASIRILQKNGFEMTEAGSEAGLRLRLG